MSIEKQSVTPLTEAALTQAAACLRTLSHPVRLRMVELLLDGKYTVGELADECGILQHVASEHLRLMQHCQLLDRERDGRRIYYSVCEPALASIITCVRNRFGNERTANTPSNASA